MHKSIEQRSQYTLSCTEPTIRQLPSTSSRSPRRPSCRIPGRNSKGNRHFQLRCEFGLCALHCRPLGVYLDDYASGTRSKPDVLFARYTTIQPHDTQRSASIFVFLLYLFPKFAFQGDHRSVEIPCSPSPESSLPQPDALRNTRLSLSRSKSISICARFFQCTCFFVQGILP